MFNTSAVAGILELIGRIILHIYLFARSAQQVFGLPLRSPGQGCVVPVIRYYRVSGLIKSWYSTKPVGKMSTGSF